MKLPILALTLLSMIGLNSCSTCKPKTEYVDKIVYVKPIVPETKDTEFPSIKLKVWGDYAIYKAQCEASINACNSDKTSILNSIKNVGNE